MLCYSTCSFVFVWLQVKTDCLPSSTFLLTKVHGSLTQGAPNFHFLVACGSSTHFEQQQVDRLVAKLFTGSYGPSQSNYITQ